MEKEFCTFKACESSKDVMTAVVALRILTRKKHPEIKSILCDRFILYSTFYLSYDWFLIWQFCMEMMRFQSWCFQLKSGTSSALKKGFRFPENLFEG